MDTSIFKSFTVLAISMLAIACSGEKTFHDYARAGDTVAVAAGYVQNFQQDNITVTITNARGNLTYAVIPAGSSAIRAAINFYPDPLSSVIVSRAIGEELTPYADTYIQTTESNFTEDRREWYQKVVFVDLPTNLPTGSVAITVSNPEGQSAKSIVQIIEGTGSPSTFTAFGATQLDRNMLGLMERVEHSVINVTNETSIPHAVQLTLTHDLDKQSGGLPDAGIPFAVNPTGFLKSMHWSDDGTNMKVILMPTSTAKPLDRMSDFQFYVAGGLKNLAVASVQGYDIDGNPVAGTSATATVSN